jgi:hypothetical protein
MVTVRWYHLFLENTPPQDMYRKSAYPMLYQSLPFKILCVFLFVLCLAACNPGVSGRGQALPPWTHHWLQSNAACRAPCWEGITPGQTQLTQASSLLSHNPLIQSTTIFTSSVAPDQSEIDWQWGTSTFGGRAFYNAQISPPIIQVLQVNYPDTFLLQELIASYGAPSHIIATMQVGGFPGESPASAVDYSIWVVYLDKGLLLGADRHQGGDIRPDLALSTPTFFIPDRAQFTTFFDQTHSVVLVPWQGYQDFAYYCRAGSTTSACRIDMP